MNSYCFKYENKQLVDIMIHHYMYNKDIIENLKNSIKKDILNQDKYHEEVHQELLSLIIDVKTGRNREAFDILKERCHDLEIILDNFSNN